MTVSGANPNKPCIFPFKYNGGTYYACTLDNAHFTENKPWCSTLVDNQGNHINGQGKWGSCGSNCPMPGKYCISR